MAVAKKRAVAVDVDFDPTWIKIVEAIGASSRGTGGAGAALAVEAAGTLACLLGDIVARLDVFTEKLDGKKIPAAKAAFDGIESDKAEASSEEAAE